MGQTAIPAADRTENYIPFLDEKKIAVVANQTSMVGKEHLVDYLVGNGIKVKHVFAPEHGFRGKADAGAKIEDGMDPKTGLAIYSLYGKNKKPSSEQLEGIDLILFDIQDVGARFYTYISTLHYVMEAAAEKEIPVILLDRPNPNIHYVDGPVLEPKHQSFVGMHPVPVVYGMTIGEYGNMIIGEGWLETDSTCDLTVIPVGNYSRETSYTLPVKPSPNLPNKQSISLYPSLCFFEGTPISAGRGTDMQFQIFGSPILPESQFPYRFRPQSNPGAKYPKFENETCFGRDLRDYKVGDRIELKWLIESYQSSSGVFFNSFFTKLAGTEELQKQIESGLSQQEIRASWSEDIQAFLELRKPYLIYHETKRTSR